MEEKTSEEISTQLIKIYGCADNHDKSFGKKKWVSLEAHNKKLSQIKKELKEKIEIINKLSLRVCKRCNGYNGKKLCKCGYDNVLNPLGL